MRKIIGLILILSLLYSCSKDDDWSNEVPEGTFVGVLEVNYYEDNSFDKSNKTIKDTTVVTFNKADSTYVCSTRGNGHYRIEKKGQLVFQDENYWTADFDWGLILSGTYDYKLNGDKLTLIKDNKTMGRYEYRLVRQ